MNTTKRRPRKGLGDCEMVEAILALAGVAFTRSYFGGGWTRAVNVGNTSMLFDRWGARYVMTTGNR